MLRLGVHVSIAGGIYKAIERANFLGCTTMQIFSHNPRGWSFKELKNDDIKAFKTLREKTDIKPLVIHTSYLINLCSHDEELYRKSKEAFLAEIERANLLGADYLVTHLGSTGQSGEREGIKRVVEALKDFSKRWRKISGYSQAKVLLENTAGERGEIGYSVEQISEIFHEAEDGLTAGICLDTCHAFSAGYDFSMSGGIGKFINIFDRTIGLDYLKVIHLNDSKRPLGSRVDRHEDIGKGKIGIKGFRELLNHPKIKNIPLILETPKKSEEDDIRNLRMVRKLLCKKGNTQ